MQKTARKKTKYSRSETILKIGHHAKAIAHAKSSLSVKNYNSKNNVKIHSQCRSKGNISGGAREWWRREPLWGSGGMLPQKNLKSRDLEMLFPAFSESYL